MPATPVLSTRVVALTGAANTLTAFAQNAVVTVNHGSATALTIPANSVTPFPVGTQIHVIQTGAGAVTLGITGDTIVPATSNTTNAGDTLVLTKTSSTGWHCGVAVAA